MKSLIRAQNWLFRQILIYPLRNALLVLGLVVLVGWGTLADGHALTDDLYYPVLVAGSVLNLAHALWRRRRRGRR